ncbi:MAG: hypothetical protein J5594_03695 [Elusimicrobiaceae bacterium]|nr:hypothetical protein [Elusimicrobiaceae bacterium]
MKKFILPILFIVIAACFCACVHEEPYNRNSSNSYEQKLRRYSFLPFMYEDKFYAYYAPATRISGPDRKGNYKFKFAGGPRQGEKVKSKNAIIRTYESNGYDLKKGMVVLVNHFNPKVHDDNARIDTWRLAVVYSLQNLENNIVVVELPHDKNDFAAQKEAYYLKNVRVITKPDDIRDIRNFIY